MEENRRWRIRDGTLNLVLPIVHNFLFQDPPKVGALYIACSAKTNNFPFPSGGPAVRNLHVGGRILSLRTRVCTRSDPSDAPRRGRDEQFNEKLSALSSGAAYTDYTARRCTVKNAAERSASCTRTVDHSADPVPLSLWLPRRTSPTSTFSPGLVSDRRMARFEGTAAASEVPGRSHSRSSSVSMSSWSRVSERASSRSPSVSTSTSSTVASTPSSIGAHQCYAVVSVQEGSLVDEAEGLAITDGWEDSPAADVRPLAHGATAATTMVWSARTLDCASLRDALRMVRRAFSSAETGNARSQYPPSPSLLRLHPSTRHGAAAKLPPRRRVYRLIGALVFLATVLVLAVVQNPARMHSSTQAVRAYWAPGATILSKPSERAAAIDAGPLPGAARTATNATGTADKSSPPEAKAEAKAQQAIDSALAKNARRKTRKKADYSRLLPLGAPPRRYRWGANFIIAGDDKSRGRANGRRKMPLQKQLEKLYETGRQKYLDEESDWRAFEWAAPPPHSSLARFTDKLDSVSAVGHTDLGCVMLPQHRQGLLLTSVSHIDRTNSSCADGSRRCTSSRPLAASVSEPANSQTSRRLSHRCQCSIAAIASSGTSSSRRRRLATPGNAKDPHGSMTTRGCMPRCELAFSRF